MRELTQSEQDTLERLIDQTSLCAVMRALVQICRDKEEHLRSNWQDTTQAKEWASSARRIERAEKEMVF